MAKPHTHPCSAWLERSCATGSHGTCCSPDCRLGIGPCPSVEAELFHLKNTKKFPGVLQLSQFLREPSHHQPQAALRNGKSSCQSPSPYSHPFYLQIKTPPLTSSTLFSGCLPINLLTQHKAGSSALWLTIFIQQRKSSVNNLLRRLSKKQSKKVSAVLENFLCTGILIKPGERKQ